MNIDHIISTRYIENRQEFDLSTNEVIEDNCFYDWELVINSRDWSMLKRLWLGKYEKIKGKIISQIRIST